MIYLFLDSWSNLSEVVSIITGKHIQKKKNFDTRMVIVFSTGMSIDIQKYIQNIVVSAKWSNISSVVNIVTWRHINTIWYKNYTFIFHQY